MNGPSLDEAVEWRIPIWAPAVSCALKRAAYLLPRGAKVLEVGYNTGMMSCFMASQYRWHVVGYDISESIRSKAVETARKYNLQDLIDFRVCLPSQTLSLKGSYDAVFIKSLLYHICDKAIYRAWLDWIHGVVRDGGLAIVVENGKGGLMDIIYRRGIKKSRWANFLLFDKWAEQEFQRRFTHVDARYFGRFSHLLSPWPRLCEVVRALEEKLWPANADHCFVASIVAHTQTVN
jgi:predicted O-methyltransferase YrrM